MSRKNTLSKVLELKGYEQEQLESRVRQVNELLTLEREKLESLERMLRKTDARFNSHRDREPVNVTEMTLFYDYLAHLRRKIEEQKGVVFRLSSELEMRKTEMVEVYKEKRIFEKLRDRVVDEENRHIVKLEQKEADYNYLSKGLRK
jgi:flagellar protein FliJ